MKKLIPFAIAIVTILIIMADRRLPGHYVLTHYDTKDVLLQITWGLIVGFVCLVIARHKAG